MKRFATLIFFLFISSSVFSQSKQYLDSVSQRLLLAFNENFVLIDAYKDGLLKEGDNYSFVYKDNVLKFNGRELSGDLAAHYISRINIYTQCLRYPSYEYFHIEGDNFNLKKASTYFRRYTPTFTTSPKKQASQNTATIDSAIVESYDLFIAPEKPSKRMHDSILICSLYADKLIDGKSDLNIRFNTDDVLVNKKKLDDGQNGKFLTLSQKAIDATSISKSDFVLISFSKYEVMYYINNTNFSTNIPPINKEEVVVEVYPSPAKDIVNILVGDGDINFTAKLVDEYGRLVKESTDRSISVSDIPSGIYFVMVSYQNTMQTKRVIVMH